MRIATSAILLFLALCVNAEISSVYKTPEERKELHDKYNNKFATFNYILTDPSNFAYDITEAIYEYLPWQGLSLPGINPLISASTKDGVGYGYGTDSEPGFVRLVVMFQTHWEIPIIGVTLYSLMITIGPKLMKVPYKPRTTMSMWNFSLSLFSWIGLMNVLPTLLFGRDYHTDEPIGVLNGSSYYKNLCSDTAYYGVGRSGFWVVAFILSKFPELIDTLWLVLAKAEVIFLHWYHHISVLLFCWHAYAERASLGIHFCCMNYTVHGIMYFYYAMTQWSMETRKMVKPYALYITLLQVAQMAGGIIFVCSAAYFKYVKGYECHSTGSTIAAAFVMYSSYFVLFFQLLYGRYDVVQKYLGSKKPKKKSA